MVNHPHHSNKMVEQQQETGKETWLIIRKDEGIDRTKYQLSNAPADTPIERLAEMSCARFWIERMLEDANGVGG
jgi:SRSO17 transposase